MGIYEYLLSKGYENRKSQTIMMDLVRDTIKKGDVKLIEAPTGTGKTFAYLIPLMEEGVKCIISTGTKALQDQLKRDIEFLSAYMHVIYGKDVKYAVVKGKANYLCLDRYGEIGKIEEIEDLLERGWDGDLTIIPLDQEIFEKINIDEDYCTSSYRKVCPYYESCLYWSLLKEREKNADIIVVNHSLLGLKEFEDSKDRILIIDEAHELDRYLTLSSVFSISLYFIYQIKKHIEDLGGKLNIVPDFFFSSNFESLFKEDREEVPLEQFLPFMKSFKKDIAEPLLGEWKKIRENFINSVEEFLSSRLMISFKFKTFLESTGLLNYEVLSSVKAGYEEETAEEKELIKKIKAIEFIDRKINKIKIFIKIVEEDREDIGYKISRKWSKKLNTFNYKMEIFPVFPKDIIDINSFRGIVLTSATIDPEDIELTTGIVGKYFSLPYNFDYRKVTFIIEDADPRDEDWKEVIKESYLYIKTLHRKVLILLTNKNHMDIFKEFKDVGKQGNKPLMKLIEDFVKGNIDVILGFDSLWTGIDIKGEKGILMSKLPFESPEDPITFHRLRFLKLMGMDPFHYQRKKAFIKFRQGFGRLVRQKGDWGTVILCDKRIWRYREFISFLKNLGIRIVYRSKKLSNPALKYLY